MIYVYTGRDGKVDVVGLIRGCPPGSMEVSAALVPPGYRLTTPASRSLPDGGFAYFGFAPLPVTLMPATPIPVPPPPPLACEVYTAEEQLTPDVYDVAIAPGGDVWFATLNGVSRFSPATADWTRFTNADGLAGSFNVAVETDAQGIVWALSNAGLSRFDGNGWSAYLPDDPAVFKRARDLAVSPDGSAWVTLIAYSQLLRFVPGQHVWISYDLGRSAEGIGVRSDGSVWLLTNTVAVLKAGAQGTAPAWFTRSLEHPRDPSLLTVAPDGKVWFAGSEGVGPVTALDDVWLNLAYVARLWPPLRDPTALAVGRDNTVWIGTAAQGVYRVSGENTAHYDAGTGLPDIAIRSLAIAEDGSVWIGGDGAVHCRSTAGP